MSRAFDRYRPSFSERYDHRWERATRQYRQAHPWCIGCLAIGVQRKAEVIDHIVPHRGDERLFWDPNNWQPACKWHHDAIKPTLERAHSVGKLTASELVLSSSTAVALTRSKHRPAIGADGFAIPGT